MPNVTINMVKWGSNRVTNNSGVFSVARQFTDYTLVPKRTGYTFTPSSITVSANGADQTNLIFTATQVLAHSPPAPNAATYALVGHVRDTIGNGI